MEKREIVLTAENISKVYGKGKNAVHAVNGVSLELEEGKFYAVLGKSGCGKSTLLNILSSLDQPSAGMVCIRGRDITKLNDRELSKIRRKDIGFVFQAYQLLSEFSALENVCMPFYIAGEKADEEHIRELMEILNIWELRDRFPMEMSGGEQQRVAIARAMAARPAILFADEPTGNLDAANGIEVARMLRTAADVFNQTIMMVTHDESLTEYADEILRMRDGRIEG